MCVAYEQSDLRGNLWPTLAEDGAEQRNLACLIALSALTTRRSGTYGAICKCLHCSQERRETARRLCAYAVRRRG